MSRFFVGQRVRIKWASNFPFLAGQEATVLSKIDDDDVPPGTEEWEIAPDCWGTSRTPDDIILVAPSEQLEPATDSNTKVGWATCAWKPQHLRDGERKRQPTRRRAPREGLPA
jgi:hypothetical protein